MLAPRLLLLELPVVGAVPEGGSGADANGGRINADTSPDTTEAPEEGGEDPAIRLSGEE